MKIVIHGISRQNKTSKDGTPYQRVGLKYRGKWYSGFGDDVTDTWEVGNEVDVDLWFEEGKPDENGDVKEYGQFVRLTTPTNRPKMTETGAGQSPAPAQPPVSEVDASTIPDLNPEANLPF